MRSKLLLILVLLVSCSIQPSSVSIKDADNVSIYYGVSSYAMFSNNENTLGALTNLFNDLQFEPTENKMDMLSMISVHFSKGNKQIYQVCVDEAGVFWLNGDTMCNKISSGDFS